MKSNILNKYADKIEYSKKRIAHKGLVYLFKTERHKVTKLYDFVKSKDRLKWAI